MAVLLTGGAGFIGSHICVELLDRGEDIILLDNYHNSKREVPGIIKEITGRDFPVYEADILDEPALRAVFKENAVEAVIHLAGLKAVGESVSRPLAYYENNIIGSIRLLRVMDDFACRRIVFSSSATVYGADAPVPYREGFPVSAANPYGWTKLFVERIIQDTRAADPSWSAAILRYFNPVGAHGSGLIGEDPEDIPNNLMPRIAKVATGELPALTVYGGDYETPDGTGVRDYIHISDLAAGHRSALDHIRENSSCEVVNLGTGKGYSVLEMLRAYEKACGKPLSYTVSPRRPGDIAAYYADVSYARELLGWEAKLGLDDMCASSWKFMYNKMSRS